MEGGKIVAGVFAELALATIATATHNDHAPHAEPGLGVRTAEARQILPPSDLLVADPLEAGSASFHLVFTKRPGETCNPLIYWRSLRDSNSCSSLERAVSWASRRRERISEG